MFARFLTMRQIVAFCVFAVAAAAPSLKLFTNQENTLLSYDSENGGTSNEIVLKPQINYHYKNGPSDNRKTGDRCELDRLIDEILISYSWDGTDGAKSFSWVGPDGVKYTLKFVTDESPEDQTSPPQDEEEEPPGSAPVSGSCLASLIITLCLFAVAAAAPAITPQYEYKATQLCHDSDHAAVPCETGHTTSVKNEQTDGQSGDVQTSENEAFVNHGSYSVVGPDGVIYTVTYNTDSKDKPSQAVFENVKKDPTSEPTTASVLAQSEEVHNKTSENEAIVNHGSYSLVGSDGVIYILTYNADKSVDKPSQPAIDTVKEPPSEPTTVSVLENQTRQQDHFYPGSPGSPGTPDSPGTPGLPYSDAVLAGLLG